MDPITGEAAATLIRRARERSQRTRFLVRRSDHTLRRSEHLMDRTNAVMGPSEILLLGIDTQNDAWKPV
jgi:hypothetical protein